MKSLISPILYKKKLKNVSLSEKEFLPTGIIGKMFGCRPKHSKGNYNYENTMLCRDSMAVS